MQKSSIKRIPIIIIHCLKVSRRPVTECCSLNNRSSHWGLRQQSRRWHVWCDPLHQPDISGRLSAIAEPSSRLVYSFPGCLSVWPRSTFPLLQGAFEKSIVQGFRTSVMIQWPWTGNIAKTVALRNRTQHLTGGEVNNLQSPSKKTVLAHEVTLVSLEQRSISRATQNIRVCGAGDSRSW